MKPEQILARIDRIRSRISFGNQMGLLLKAEAEIERLTRELADALSEIERLKQQ